MTWLPPFPAGSAAGAIVPPLVGATPTRLDCPTCRGRCPSNGQGKPGVPYPAPGNRQGDGPERREYYSACNGGGQPGKTGKRDHGANEIDPLVDCPPLWCKGHSFSRFTRSKTCWNYN
ncbi:MAG: hypothetical protein N2646_05955 [Bellilinea sp.]|nr:hypothetical protein [Bellilinea sp.]